MPIVPAIGPAPFCLGTTSPYISAISQNLNSFLPSILVVFMNFEKGASPGGGVCFQIPQRATGFEEFLTARSKKSKKVKKEAGLEA
jgi:hypothetical protein